MTKAVTYRWNSLSEDQRKPFEDLAEEDRRRFAKEILDFKQGSFKGKSKVFIIKSQQICQITKSALEINDDLLIFLQIKKLPQKNNDCNLNSQDTDK